MHVELRCSSADRTDVIVVVASVSSTPIFVVHLPHSVSSICFEGKDRAR